MSLLKKTNLFFENWKKENWKKVYKLSHKSWKSNHSLENLKELLSDKKIIDFSVIQVFNHSKVMADILVKVKYSFIGNEYDTFFNCRAIKEFVPYKTKIFGLSCFSSWGLNPKSCLRELDLKNGETS